MTNTSKPVAVYLEVGNKKTFAVALDWPGWARSARDESAALQSLCDYGPRCARVLQPTRLAFAPPQDVSGFEVVLRQQGTTATDFGAPDLSVPGDEEEISDDELQRWQKILKAVWKTFDAAVNAAEGKTLRKGPRGGGRDLAKMVQHVRDVDVAYLRSLGGKFKVDDSADPMQVLPDIRQTILETLVGRVHGDIPAEGPRGGARWMPRYFVRRLAWHDLNHAWEIEDRAE